MEYTVMTNLFARFVKCESGATAIEYGLIASLIGVAIITTVGALGTAINTTFDKAAKGMTGAAGAK
jgi:pilus assembly protein Flp/PilA